MEKMEKADGVTAQPQQNGDARPSHTLTDLEMLRARFEAMDRATGSGICKLLRNGK